MYSQSITHKAKVIDVKHAMLTIALLDRDKSQCAACALHGVCGKGDAATFDIAVAQGADMPRIGDIISVRLDDSATHHATLWLLATPLAGLLVGIAAGHLAGLSQGLTASAGLGAMTLCFMVLFVLRKRLDRLARKRWRYIGSESH